MLFTNDQVLEYLIRKQIEGPLRAMTAIKSRDPRAEDFQKMDETIRKFYKGWIAINANIRSLGTEKRQRGIDDLRVHELQAVARDNGVKDGHQMSRFLLWVGNEAFEGREVKDMAVLLARGRELAKMFLLQDKES